MNYSHEPTKFELYWMLLCAAGSGALLTVCVWEVSDMLRPKPAQLPTVEASWPVLEKP